MEAWKNTIMWLIILSCACAFLIGMRWILTHPRCRGCKKRIRHAYLYCPWCSLHQFENTQARISPKKVRTRRASLTTPDMMPHKRARTVVLPERQQQQRHGTIVVSEPGLSSHVPTCAKCHTVLDEEDQRCWYCGCKTIVWKERKR